MKVKILFLWLMMVGCGFAAQAASTIRDEETETVIRRVVTPLFKVAGLEPESVNIIILQDSSLNAFVAGGMNIFIHTGLLTFSDDPDVLAGVIAHETGHITGGHLSRLDAKAGEANLIGAAGYILGLGAAIAAGGQGGAELAPAIMLGTQNAVERNFLKFTRTQEESADQAGITYLNGVGYSAKGLAALLKHFSILERGFGDVNPYLLTHPLSRERVEFINRAVSKETANREIDPVMVADYKRVIAKLRGFLDKPKQVLQQYPLTDTSIPARYARIVAYYRMPQIDKAFDEWKKLDALIPNDPYMLELKGQILFENGRIAESIGYYQKAHAKLPDSALLKVGLAAAYIAGEKPDDVKKATQLLEQSLKTDRTNSFAWNQLAIAYGKQEKLGQSYVALTEQAALLRNKKDVDYYSALALKHLPEGSIGALRVQDIKEAFVGMKMKGADDRR